MKGSDSRWSYVALLCGTATAGYMCRVNVSTAGVLMMDEFNLSQVDMGKIFSAFLLGYALFQIPSGMLADKFGARRVLTLATWLWVLLTMIQLLPGWQLAGSVVTFSLTFFLVIRFLVGVSASPVYPASARGVSSWIKKPFRGTASGIILGSVGLGSALTPPLVSYAMVTGGWRMGMLVSAVPALMLAVLWLRVKEPDKIREDTQIGPGPDSYSSSFGWPRLILLTISYSLQSYVGYVFVSWFYLYLVQERHFSLLEGAWASSLPWVLSIISIPLGGYLSDKLVQSKLGPAWGLRMIPMLALSLSGVLIFIGARTGNAWVAAVVLAFATAFVLCVEGPFWTTVTQIDSAKSGTAGGIMNTGGNVGGLLSPVVTPWIATYIGWEGSLQIAACLAIAGGVLWIGIGSEK